MRLVSRIAPVLLVLALPVAARATALNVVNTSATTINLVYSDGSVVVNDYVVTFDNGAKLQSRTFQGEPGSPAAGKWVYLYRLDLTNDVGVLNIPYATSVGLAFGPMRQYDYNADGISTDQVWVVTQGGSGSIGLSSAGTAFGYVQFNFSSPVQGGAYSGGGQSSYFWGLISDYPPTTGTATVAMGSGNVSVSCKIPSW